MIRAVYGLMGLGMCLLSAPALANLSLVNYNGFEVRQSGNTWQFGHASSESTRLRGGTVLPNAAVSTSQRALVASKNLPVGKGLVVDVVAKIPAASFGKLIVGATKVATPVGAVLTAIELVDYFRDSGITGVKNTPNGLIGNEALQGSGEMWSSGGKVYGSPVEACNLPAGVTFVRVEETSPNLFYCWGKYSNGSQNVFSTIGKVKVPTTEFNEIDEQTIHDRIAAKSGWPSSAAIAAQKAINMGMPVETEAPTVSGPASVPGEKTTSSESIKLNPGTNNPAAPGATNTDPGTKTTTKTETKKAQYSGSNVTVSTTTNTVTNITNNVTNITTTEENKTEEKEDDEKQEDPPTDTPFKDIPELYKQKYPDGIGGVVNKKMDELKATPLFGLPALLTPSLPSSGSCPSWQLDLSLASWAGYGAHTIQAPCWVWDFGKVVIIISALLLARRLIFGG